jgi:hypothetical protein
VTGGHRSRSPEVGVDLVIDLRAETIDLAEVQHRLDELAADLSILSSAAMDTGDFDEITRLIEASQAVQRAVLSLREDTAVA